MNDYEILLEELNNTIAKWQQRLNYQSNEGKDVHDCLLCSTIIYEIERAKQKANLRLSAINEENFRKRLQSKEEEKLNTGSAIKKEGHVYKDNQLTWDNIEK